MQKICDKLIVSFVWLLIFTIATGFCTLYLTQLHTKNQIYFYVITILLCIVFILLVISYAKATCTDPGSPSNQLTIHYEKYSKIQQIKAQTSQRQTKKRIRRKNNFAGRLNQQEVMQQIRWMKTDQYCNKCLIVRPPRTHHCSHCNKCILRMDHHCPWTGNCIGQYNHKYFLLFLLYATIGSGIVSFNIIIDWFTGHKVMMDVQIQWKIYLVLIIGVASLLLFLAIGLLFIGQLIASADNLTTLQTFTQGIQQHNPFDKNNVLQNFKQIFGVEGCALLPTQPLFKFQGYTQDIDYHF